MTHIFTERLVNSLMTGHASVSSLTEGMCSDTEGSSHSCASTRTALIFTNVYYDKYEKKQL